jgi:Type III restriction enzyme, res subunit
LGFDYSSFLNKKESTRQTDPEVLFQTLKIRDPKVERLWGEQVDALRGWRDKKADSSDTLVQLNTGAGKTLVGLLIAQAIINRTSGHVLYLCSTNQLVKQTAEKAELYGLGMATYTSGVFSDDLFERGEAACATSYASIFNGFTTRKHRFKDFALSAIIFDDAHTAESIIRGSYTITIQRSKDDALYSQIADFYRTAFEALDKRATFEGVLDGSISETLLAPQFVTSEVAAELTDALKVKADSDEIKYVWPHLADVIDRCVVLIGPSSIEISPPFIDIGSHFAFSRGIERVYLSATLDATDAFIRTFGDRPLNRVTASTNSGDGERQIVVPSLFKDESGADTEVAKTLALSRKALVSVPTYKRASTWNGFASILDSETGDVDVRLTEFRDASDDRKVVLVARYDGLDLPEDSCRMMIIDESPSGASVLERFLHERLGLTQRLQSTIASRIVQSFGRICRGIKDHGCFILTGSSLLQWLKRPANQNRHPKFLRRQLTSALKLSETVSGAGGATALIEDFFACHKDGGQPATWSHVYEMFMKDWQADPDPTAPSDVLVREARAEVRFAKLLFDGKYATAASTFGEIVDQVFNESSGNGAWIAYWLAFALQRAGDEEMARHYYSRAHGASNGLLGRPPAATPESHQFSVQLQNVASIFSLHQETGKLARLFARVQRDLAPLKNPEATPNQHAAAIDALGHYLGLLTFRPDPGDSGPDAHWYLPECPSLSLELKTQKNDGPCYSKEDLGQVDDHLRWAHERYPDASTYECILVGRDLPACKGTSPGEKFFSASLEEFARIGDELRAAIEPVCATASPLEFLPAAYEALKTAELTYDELLERLPRRPIRLEVQAK